MSIWDSSLETANSVYAIAWIGIIIGAIMTAIALSAVYWSSSIRDKNSDLRVAQAHAKGDEANAEAAKANERAAELEVAATRANLELEKERIARLKLEEKLKPRNITDAQRDQFLDAVTNDPTGEVAIISQMFDQEAGNYAKQITSLLEKAGFVIVDYMGSKDHRPLGFAESGVFIYVHNINTVPAYAKTIQKGFEAIGVTAEGIGDPLVLPDPAHVVVAIAPKP